MEARDVLKAIMVQKQITNAELAKKLDITQATLWDRLNNRKGRKDIPVSLLSEMLMALDYEIQILPKDTPVPTNGYKVQLTETVKTTIDHTAVSKQLDEIFSSKSPNPKVWTKDGKVKLTPTNK